MRIAFIDESMSPGFYHLGALLLDTSESMQVRQILNSNMALVARDFPNEINPNIEFHGSHIWNGKGNWRNIGDRYRFAVIIHTIEQICKLNIEIILQGINRRKLEETYLLPEPPQFLGFKYLLEQIDRRFDQDGKPGLVICDQLGSPNEHGVYRGHLSKYRRQGTGGAYPRYLDSIADTLHFVPSHESRGIQAIDLITYIFHRREVTRYPSKMENDIISHLWGTLEPRIIWNRTA